jgi:hypothetical protein
MSRMVVLFIILPFIIFLGCNSTPTHLNAEKDVIALEHSALDKWSQGSSIGFVDIGADDVTWYEFTPGEQPRIDSLEALRKYLAPFEGQIPPHTYEIVNPKVQVYENTAILTFHWKGTLKDGTPIEKWKVTSVYHWKDSKWQMVHAHWSLVQGT